MIRRVVRTDGDLKIGSKHDTAETRTAFYHGNATMQRGTEVYFMGGRWYSDNERIMLYDITGKFIGFAEEKESEKQARRENDQIKFALDNPEDRLYIVE